MRTYKMTWVASRRGWMKEYKGKKYAVSCRQLGMPEDKENKADSYQAANSWWEAKKAEIDAAGLPVHRAPLPLEDLASASLAAKGIDLIALARIVQKDYIAERLRRLARLSPEIRAAVEALFADDDEPESQFIGQVIESEVSPLIGSIAATGEPLPDGIAGQLPPARVNQLQDAAKSMRGEPATAVEKTVKANAGRWVATQQALVAAGSLAPDHADNRRICLNHFTAFLGEAADVNTVNAERLHDFYLWCLQKVESRRKDRKEGWSIDYAKKVFGTARAFVRFLWESGLIELPRNLDSRGFRFNGGAKDIKVWTADEVRRVIGEAPGQLKLHLLLMANCGFTQQDVSDLADDEVDWSGGRIIRKRSKTGDKESVPTVEYPLWPLTWELLQKHRSGSERVLLTESGKPFVRKELVNGKYSKADNIRSNFAHLKRRLRLKKSMKLLRKTGSTMLDTFDPSGGVSTLYLGHSPRSMKDRHYSRPDQAHFDRAIEWLGQQFGFVPANSTE